MAFLEQFSEQERELIVALPYRAGLWVSKSDAAGGAKADHDELAELEAIIAEHASGMFGSAFVHEVMVETCTRQKDWRAWGESLETVPDECGRVVSFIDSKLAVRDLDAYRAQVMGIGLAVAKAFREEGQGKSLPGRIALKIQEIIRLFCSILRRDRSYDPASTYNISTGEDAALTALSKALHPGV